MQAWERSKFYDEDPEKWRINQSAYKKAREELKKEKAGAGQTLAEKKADLKAQLAALG